ncbi:hypothetical protein T484DRAFT_1765081 [Baffinella frigidus]|nr:hypothetical protein T484DRAFT_1765081 [Cryptophyta sp. CCMP2293]
MRRTTLACSAGPGEAGDPYLGIRSTDPPLRTDSARGVVQAPYAGWRQRGEDGQTGHGHTTVLIVPTGVGASIGGFAGDALPVARVLSTVSDTLITHPNVVNGAMLYWPMPNMLYTETEARPPPDRA